MTDTVDDKGEDKIVSQGETDQESSHRFKYLFHNMEDAAVEFEFVENRPIVRAVNSAFTNIFGYEKDTIEGHPLNDFIIPEAHEGESHLFDTRTESGEHNKAVVRRETTSGVRRFLYRGIPYERRDGSSYGFAIYSNITEETRREHRLQVLHRILRHNLRNKLNVINGLAERIETNQTDIETVEAAQGIQAKTTDLTHLSAEAGNIERILDRTKRVETSIDVVDLCERVVSEYRSAYPEAEITLNLPRSLTLTATDHIEIALQELVENAVEHNDSATPKVRLAATQARSGQQEWITISVADDGPMIQQGEKQIMNPNSGSDQLSHGSGLGLRLVQWITDVAGGTITVDESDLGGNIVELQFKQ